MPYIVQSEAVVRVFFRGDTFGMLYNGSHCIGTVCHGRPVAVITTIYEDDDTVHEIPLNELPLDVQFVSQGVRRKVRDIVAKLVSEGEAE